MYNIIFEKKAKKQIDKLDNSVKKIIKKWLLKNLVGCENPRLHGRELTGNKSGLWRYRIGDYRIIADIQDDKLVIVAISIEHRKQVYKD